MRKRQKTIELVYEYKPDEYTQQKLEAVFDSLFDEVAQLLTKEKPININQIHEKAKRLSPNT